MDKWKSLAITAGLTGLSAAIAFGVDYAAGGGFGAYSALATAALTVALKAVQKYLQKEVPSE